MDDHNPVRIAARVLQSHWEHAARHAVLLHDHLGGHLQRLLVPLHASDRSQNSTGHFRRRYHLHSALLNFLSFSGCKSQFIL